MLQPVVRLDDTRRDAPAVALDVAQVGGTAAKLPAHRSQAQPRVDASLSEPQPIEDALCVATATAGDEAVLLYAHGSR